MRRRLYDLENWPINFRENIPMQRPLVALLFASKFCEDIDFGNKTVTIREGHRDYQEGDKALLYCNQGNDDGWAGSATIKSVQHVHLKDVDLHAIQSEGFMDHEEAEAGLKEHYPNLNLGSDVTVIHFEVVR